MVDLVGTCPKDFWEEWIAEGDAAGEPPTCQEWSWYTRHPLALQAQAGDRFYVVAHGKLRGYAPITVVRRFSLLNLPKYAVCRESGAVACTIDIPITGFRGLRKRWWSRDIEVPFPKWKTP